MPVQAWKLYASALRYIGDGTIDLGTGIMKMSFHRSAASTNIIQLSTLTIFSEIANEISSRGGYTAGGRTLPPATGGWTVGTSAKQMKFTYTASGLVFTANGSDLNNIRFALIHFSVGAVTSGPLLCYASLSSSQFSIVDPNTITIIPNTNGVFTLA